MRIPNEKIFTRMNPEAAANVVIEVEEAVSSMQLEGIPPWQLFNGLKRAIAFREQNGLRTKPTSRTEIGGLVRSVMGGYDHLQAVRKELNRYTVGLLQTDESSLQKAHADFYAEHDDTFLLPAEFKVRHDDLRLTENSGGDN